MKRLATFTVWGCSVGTLVTSLALLLLPYFYSQLHELLILPGVAAFLAALLGGVFVLATRRRERSQDAFHPGRGRVSLVALCVCVAVALALYAFRAPARSWKVAPKLLVLCIDGGTWDIIDPLLESGRMPTIARLRKEGASGVLQSTDPMFTPIVWTTMVTGVVPEKHGITSFYATQEHLKKKRIWEVFRDHGRSVGLFRWVVTWPPLPTDGFTIPDILARDSRSIPDKYAFINEFRIQQKGGHATPLLQAVKLTWKFLRSGLRMSTCIDAAWEIVPALLSGRYADFHVAARRAELRLNADVYCHLLREIQPEFTAFYDNGGDVLSHYYWEYYQPDKFGVVDPVGVRRYGTAIPEYYELNDEVFGEIVDHLESPATVAVLSDHGSTAAAGGSQRQFFPRIEPVLSEFALDDEYYGVALGWQTFVEAVRAQSDERKAALERAVAVLNAVTVVETGLPLFHAEVEEGRRVVLSVSTSLDDLTGHVEGASGLVPTGELLTTRSKSGTHHTSGIYIFAGGAFRAGHAGRQHPLVDVAPTLLYALGFPLSREFDGSVASDLVTDEFLKTNEIAWIDTFGDLSPTKSDIELDDETRRQLEAVGYVR